MLFHFAYDYAIMWIIFEIEVRLLLLLLLPFDVSIGNGKLYNALNVTIICGFNSVKSRSWKEFRLAKGIN